MAIQQKKKKKLSHEPIYGFIFRIMEHITKMKNGMIIRTLEDLG